MQHSRLTATQPTALRAFNQLARARPGAWPQPGFFLRGGVHAEGPKFLLRNDRVLPNVGNSPVGIFCSVCLGLCFKLSLIGRRGLFFAQMWLGQVQEIPTGTRISRAANRARPSGRREFFSCREN